ncbi:MAG: hypothetical protein VX255_07270 [Candidatus Latescibacterota bacterium]|nr:hypothetical protein [Candidatus Latescibacterota bacterium]
MKQISILPDAPHTLMEHDDGHLVIALHKGLAQYVDGTLDMIDEGAIHSSARGPDGRYYCTRSGRVLCFDIAPNGAGDMSDANALSAQDITASFAGTVHGDETIVCTPDGALWVEGCTTALSVDGAYTVNPATPVTPAPVPHALDIYGNRWSLTGGAGHRQPLVLPANAPDAWQLAWLPAGDWQFLFADSVGYVWVIGNAGIRRFCPRHMERGWQIVSDNLPGGTVTAVGLSPNELLMTAFSTGEIYELDTSADNELVTRPLATAPAAPVALLTDRRGNIWAGTADGLHQEPAGADAWQHSWERKRGRLPGGGNHDIFSVECQGKLYVAGGWAGQWGLPPEAFVVEDLFSYDPSTEYWDIARSLIIPRRYNGIAEMGGQVWVVGGETRIRGWEGEGQVLYTVDIFDPASESWAPGPSLNVARTDPFVVSCNGRIYAIGGAAHNGGPKLDSVESIGLSETTWRMETSLPEPTRQGHACALDGVIYCASIDGMYAYDVSEDRWDEDFPQPGPIGQGPLAAAYEGEVWVIGGFGDQGTRCYDPKARSWRKGPDLPTEQAWASAVVMDGELMVIGGAHGSPQHDAIVFDDRTYALRH